MARSSVSICNMALAFVGNDGLTISSLNESSKPARTCKLFYDEIRQATLRAHPWNFAIRRATLAQLDTEPEFEYAYAYALPNDFLRIIRTDAEAEGMEDDYRIEGETGSAAKVLLSDEGEVSIEYVADITNPNAFDPTFVQAFALRLAAAVTPALTDDPGRANALLAQYRDMLREARAADAQEGKPRSDPADKWTGARR